MTPMYVQFLIFLTIWGIDQLFDDIKRGGNITIDNWESLVIGWVCASESQSEFF